VELPMVAVRAQVAAALNIIICCARFPDGSRRLTNISELLPLNEKGDYRVQDLFVYTPTGKDEQGRIQGFHAPTGILPTFLGKLKTFDFPEMDESFFDPGTYGYPPPSAELFSELRVRFIERLKGGQEQWEPKRLEPEKQKLLDGALEEALRERDLEPPPMAEDQDFYEEAERPAEVQSESKPSETAEKDEQTGSRPKVGSYARQLLGTGGSGKGPKSSKPRVGVRSTRPVKPKKKNDED
jgi:hypothetical protein